MTVRRLKTYTGSTGYVYQYYFVGQRPKIGPAEPKAQEFIFDVSSDRKTSYPVSVVLPADAVEAWVARHGRPLTHAEQYAGVKLRLFQAFDELEDLAKQRLSLTVDSQQLERALESLGVQ
jgi:hypothetical protein